MPMIDILYACQNTSEEHDFLYHDDGSHHDWWLLLQVRTPSFFIINGKKILMPPETAILYPPHSALHYGSSSGEFINNWIRFYTDEDFICNGKIPFQTPFEIKQPGFTNELFLQLASENFFDNKNKQQSIQHLFKLMFYKLEESLSALSDNIQLKELLTLRMSIKNNPGFNWTVPYMADTLHISIGHLHNIYREAFGISCMDDVIQIRLELAKDYLKHSLVPIKVIADNCGYNNVEHFSRQFKKITGMSPRQYRLTHNNN